jgi:hypothetical protein
MLRYSTVLLTLLALGSFLSAAEKPATVVKADKPSGTWTHTAGEFTVTFTFEGLEMKIEAAKNDAESVTVHAAYGVTDDGVLFGYTTSVEKKGVEEGPEKGDLFSFAYKIDGDTLTLSDLNGSKPPSEAAKQLIQGEYKRVKK